MNVIRESLGEESLEPGTRLHEYDYKGLESSSGDSSPYQSEEEEPRNYDSQRTAFSREAFAFGRPHKSDQKELRKKGNQDTGLGLNIDYRDNQFSQHDPYKITIKSFVADPERGPPASLESCEYHFAGLREAGREQARSSKAELLRKLGVGQDYKSAKLKYIDTFLPQQLRVQSNPYRLLKHRLQSRCLN